MGALLMLTGLVLQPQDALPDILIWLVQGTKKIAYHRIPARELLHSQLPEERGMLCAKLHSFYLKVSTFSLTAHYYVRSR